MQRRSLIHSLIVAAFAGATGLAAHAQPTDRAAMADRESDRVAVRAGLEAYDRRVRGGEPGHQDRAGAGRAQGPLDEVRRRRAGAQGAVHRLGGPDDGRVQRLPVAARQVLQRRAGRVPPGVERWTCSPPRSGTRSCTGCRSGAARTPRSTTATWSSRPDSIPTSRRDVRRIQGLGEEADRQGPVGDWRCSAARPTRRRACCSPGSGATAARRSTPT